MRPRPALVGHRRLEPLGWSGNHGKTTGAWPLRRCGSRLVAPAAGPEVVNRPARDYVAVHRARLEAGVAVVGAAGGCGGRSPRALQQDARRRMIRGELGLGRAESIHNHLRVAAGVAAVLSFHRRAPCQVAVAGPSEGKEAAYRDASRTLAQFALDVDERRPRAGDSAVDGGEAVLWGHGTYSVDRDVYLQRGRSNVHREHQVTARAAEKGSDHEEVGLPGAGIEEDLGLV